MADPFADKDFLKNLGRELDRQSVHGSDRGRDRPAQEQPQAKPQRILRGEPGSPERIQHVIEIGNSIDPGLVSEMGWESVGTALQNSLHLIRAEEASDSFDWSEPVYSQEAIDAFTTAANLIAQTGSPELYAAYQNELADSWIGEYLEPAVEQAATMGRIEAYGLQKAHAESQMNARQKALENEYEDIRKRTGDVGLQAADQLAANLNENGLLYDPHADEMQLRGQMRVIAETAKATERGTKAATFLTEFDKELARIGAPGSSWTDEQREKWEAELRAGTVESVERAFGDPTAAADRAVDGMILDDARRKTGKGAMERALDAEIAKLDQHNQRAPHKRAMAKELAEEFDATHTPTGQPTTTRDGLDREVGGRYDS